MNALARITSKGQTTIPQSVRAALGLSPGDSIVWEVGDDGTARVRRAAPLDLESLRAGRHAERVVQRRGRGGLP